MKRRTFLRRTAPVLALPLALPGISLEAFARTPQFPRTFLESDANDRILVIIQLEGGNDGLNTVIPVDDDIYYRSRPTLAIPKQSALPLDGEPLLRMHPALGGMQRLFNQGKLAIIDNIGYDNYSLSHFSGIELWNTASSGGIHGYQASGWMGRFLQEDFPDYPDVLPEHPPAIQIRASVSSVFSSGNSTIGLALTDPEAFHELVNGGPAVIGSTAPDTPAGREWNYIQTVNTQALLYSDIIRTAAARAKNMVEYPGGGTIAESLAIIARLIAGGLKTRVYMVSMGSFDTHGNQLPHHENILGQLGSAVGSFMDDLAALGVDRRVIGMTYSEFGRRIQENASGTDHGAAAPHFVFGTQVDGGRVLGGLPDLEHPDDLGNLRHAITFQCYYASVIAPLFQLEEERLGRIIPLELCDARDRLRLYHTWTSPQLQAPPALAESFSCTPSPASSSSVIRYHVAYPGYALIELTTLQGRTVARAAEGYHDPGDHMIRLDLAGIPSGTYFCSLHADGITRTRKLVIRH